LKIIQREDSLQKVAKMTEPERNALIASIIAKTIKDKSEGKTADNSDRYNLGQYMRMKDVFRGISIRKANGIFIIRQH